MAESVANSRSIVPVGGLRGALLGVFRRLRGIGDGSDFLNRANADPISFSQSAIDRPGFGYAHFGAVDEKRDIRRIGVTITDKALASAGSVNGRLKRVPTIS